MHGQLARLKLAATGSAKAAAGGAPLTDTREILTDATLVVRYAGRRTDELVEGSRPKTKLVGDRLPFDELCGDAGGVEPPPLAHAETHIRPTIASQRRIIIEPLGRVIARRN